jgi:hypothetical protein
VPHQINDPRPRDDRDAAQYLARDLAEIAGHISQLKGDANAYLTDLNYNTLRLRLENAHAGVEAAMVEARRRVRLNEGDGGRRGFLRLAAKGRITDEELDEELAPLEATRRTVERELAALRQHAERVEQMERDRDAVLEHYATLAPEALDSLTSEERHHLYKMLKLKVWLGKSGDLEIEMAGVPVDGLDKDGSSTTELTPT